ncbi:C-C motif chemokine 2-like isoform X1 [Sphaeramia orbicularis]|uniref:C-C motif chemokine 2-like isoform X1 n=1 Tax=Sphaeramia orbicularis TaxID=375764 RepID=UPI00117F6451|nr:C-C motif chemokine 2-like isoform X1 [Sphaeramia orbicularis]
MAHLTLFSLLLVTILVSSVASQGGIASCCRTTSNTQIHRDRLKSYYIQYPPTCHLHAVVFTTVKNVRICADPEKVWTKTSMAYLDGKNWHIQKFISKHHSFDDRGSAGRAGRPMTTGRPMNAGRPMTTGRPLTTGLTV